MSQQLRDMAITRVSLVDKGANQRRLAVLKRDEEDSMTNPAAPAAGDPSVIATWLRKAADAVLGRRVAKTLTFAERIAGQDLQDALYDSWYTLEDSLWSAIYAYDEQGQTLPIADRQALVAQNLDEFKAYLLAAMATGIEKRAGAPAEAPGRHIAAIVAKVGRKISGSRLERLQAAADTLGGVLAEVTEDTQDSADAQEEETVEKNDLIAAVTDAVAKAQEPLIARLEALEKAAPPKVEKAEAAATEGEDDPVTLEGIGEAIGKIFDRLEAIETGAGARTSVVGQDGATDVKKRALFAGMF